MWFKNITPYRFTTSLIYSGEWLEEQLAKKPHHAPMELQYESAGWTPPLGTKHVFDEDLFGQTDTPISAPETYPLVHACHGYFMLCMRVETKVLPASTVNRLLNERVDLVEAKEGRKVRGKERSALKDALLTELLPKALTRITDTYGYIDPKGGWLVVNTATDKAAEAFGSLLRETLGSLPVVRPDTKYAPAACLTQWAMGEHVPGNLQPGEDFIAIDFDGAGRISGKRTELAQEQIDSLLQTRTISALSVDWDNGRIDCVLTDDFKVKKLAFLSGLDKAAETEMEDYASRFDADFAIMTGEIRELLDWLMDAYGGEADRV